MNNTPILIIAIITLIIAILAYKKAADIQSKTEKFSWWKKLGRGMAVAASTTGQIMARGR